MTLSNDLPVRQTDRAGLWVWLVLPLLVLLATLALEVVEGRQVRIKYAQIPLPETCATYAWFGFSCPGCGLTRAFVFLSSGQLAQAWNCNPASFLFYPLLLLQVPLAAVLLTSRKDRPSWLGSNLTRRWIHVNQWMVVLALAFLLAQWFWQLMERYLN